MALCRLPILWLGSHRLPRAVARRKIPRHPVAQKTGKPKRFKSPGLFSETILGFESLTCHSSGFRRRYARRIKVSGPHSSLIVAFIASRANDPARTSLVTLHAHIGGCNNKWGLRVGGPRYPFRTYQKKREKVWFVHNVT